jgi:hypothetical protein
MDENRKEYRRIWMSNRRKSMRTVRDAEAAVNCQSSDSSDEVELVNHESVTVSHHVDIENCRTGICESHCESSESSSDETVWANIDCARKLMQIPQT